MKAHCFCLTRTLSLRPNFLYCFLDKHKADLSYFHRQLSQGGYHPVEIGDHFHHRYRVAHKLGHGTYSTIWLARDEIASRYVAFKIFTADSDPLETEILSQLSESPKSSGIGTTMIPSILDRFSIQGPNGNHACLVTSPARMSLSDAKNGSWISLFPIDVARALEGQLATVVRYMHSKGFVHGDLHRGNILLRTQSNFDGLSTKQLYELYGEPDLEPVNRLDGQALPPGVPKHGIIPIWLGAPTQRSLFEGFLTNEDDMTCQQIAALGPLPTEWWKKWEGRENHFTNAGDPNNRATSQYKSLEDLLEMNIQQPRIQAGMAPLELSERTALLEMLRAMRSFKPEKRPSAQQVLESEWMVKWAIPESERIRGLQGS
ncbi:kinase-like domain-containing protein [Aspergillus karnatakaensis]|uniref:kinase-like domain-containing protein n=1 Tax=Aspergillus karnatakaensis TaxID=1810916 RepID=UPI003CCE21A2